jgi:hypothetical protein
MTSPIIFCHYGNSDYLKYTLKSARYFNPGKEIILLGDSLNNDLAKAENVRHIYLSNFESNSLIAKFENAYSHIAGNTHGREFWLKFNFKRYYYIHAFLLSESIDSFWYFDSDVLIMSDLTLQEQKFNNFDFAVHSNINGFIKSSDSLYKYLLHNISAFSDDYFLMNQRNKIENNPSLALTEMATFKTFIEKDTIKSIKLNTIIDNETFDECILNSDGMVMMLNGRNFKKLYCDIFGNIYCLDSITMKYVKMISLNMSGANTLLLRKLYFTSLKSIYFKNLQIYFNSKFIFNFKYTFLTRLWHKLLWYLV